MYAETFQVGAWLEVPAKWLRWAMQAVTARNLNDARYNLNQFWNTLEAAKKQAASDLQWGDVLTLDSQSKWALGTLYQADQAEQMNTLNDLTTGGKLAAGVLSIATGGASSAAQAASVESTRARIQSLGAEAQKAFEDQRALGEQAARAYQRAGNTSNQAANSAKVGAYSATGAATETKYRLDLGRSFEKDPSILPDWLTGSWFGVPVWAWVAGAAGLAALLLTQAPRVAVVSAARSLVPAGGEA